VANNKAFRYYALAGQAIMGLAKYVGTALKANTEFSKSLNLVKGKYGNGICHIYQAILPALTSLIQHFGNSYGVYSGVCVVAVWQDV